MMVTINDLSPKPALKARLKAAFPDDDIETAELGTLFNRPNLTRSQTNVKKEMEQLAIEVANE